MAKKTINLEKAEKVLDYWYAIEFLAQDKYDDMWETRIKMQKAQKDFLKGRLRAKSIWSYRELSDTHTIYDILAEDARSCGMTRWGNITVYIGKIKREVCIECIAKLLPKEEVEERPEKSYDNIAWASLQLAPDGTYVDRSLSLSTIIWSMDQMKNNQARLAESLDEKQYHRTVAEIEKLFFKKEQKASQIPENKGLQSDEDDDGAEQIQEFAVDAVKEKDLKALFNYIEKYFIKGNIESTIEGTEAEQEYQEIYGLQFQLFKDAAERNKLGEDNYLGLSHDYFSEDIKYVLQRIKDRAIQSDGYMSDDLVRYISILGESQQEDKIDLVYPGERGEFLQQMLEILEVGNAPLGKWPSKYMPALMQQSAVNLCIRKGTSELFEINGNIFSVNGPPGTGKTTLLKEIVVSNIIERAILLASYQDPDDAFEKQAFLFGDKENRAYSSYIRGWYRLKNDDINNYSTLVTSCNNAAVENVSKELPLLTGMLKDLKPAADDTEEYAGMLHELSSLFNPEQSQIYESIHKTSCRDVYFTEYAKELFGNNGVWGLVAAPLGKRSNISSFYNSVLSPLYWDFYPGKNFKEKRLEQYEHARSEFDKQLKVVKDLQAQLQAMGEVVRKRADLLLQYKSLEGSLPQQKRTTRQLIEAEVLRIEELKDNLAQKAHDMQTAVTERDMLGHRISVLEQEGGVQSAAKQELLEKEVAARGTVGIFDKLFNQKKVRANELLADAYHEDALRAGALGERLSVSLDEIMGAWQHAQQEFLCAELSVNQLHAEITNSEYKVARMEQQIQELERQLGSIKAELSDTEPEYQKKIETFTQGSSLDAGLVLDETFINSLLSPDIKESTEAQVANPWFTKRYNLEREKLFYRAMMLNKEFVLSSRSCRDNLKTLGHYWGMLAGDEKETIEFHKGDRERFAGALYQTLFLLVPVLSTTFASLGTFLRDAKEPGVIGTLVVDEAGQAQPQMAVGALYRSRIAMIVGDPKQVEPVVTDDLNLLKRAYDDYELKPYKSKLVSVQSFADRLNHFGTWLDNGTDYPEWVGCPLLVHRRCISHMYDISNEISYNGMMKQQTGAPGAEMEASFVYEKSQWLNIGGKEKGNKNHFVEEQAKKVCEMLENAFSKSDNPSLYIISPFTSVVSGIRAYIKEYKKKTADTNLSKCEGEWLSKNIGTVHTFQGKEANEVIFLLGCDKSREAEGAIKWVNTNIVNVAVTRAKFRLYVIGDEEAWRKSSCVKQAKTILDTFAIKQIKAILEEPLPEEERAKALALASTALPSMTSFQMGEAEDENGEMDYSLNTEDLLQGLNPSFMTMELSKEQLSEFGFQSIEDLNEFSREVRNNLRMGIKLFYLLYPVFKVNNQLDASCCAILFCKAMELQMRECFETSLKTAFPHVKCKGKTELKDTKTKDFTLGVFEKLLKDNSQALVSIMEQNGKSQYDQQWWTAFCTRLGECRIKRNACCHAGFFNWKEQSQLLTVMFLKDTQNQELQLDGILFESRIGKTII